LKLFLIQGTRLLSAQIYLSVNFWHCHLCSYVAWQLCSSNYFSM